MTIHFTKMHGLGNDFMVIDGIHQRMDWTPQEIAQRAERHTGVGFDQLLVVEPAQKAGVDFNYRIFNADGQEVGQCGNGARCLALFVKYHKLTSKNQLTVATKTTQMNLFINDDDTVRVDMGLPKLRPQEIPFDANEPASIYPIELLSGQTLKVHTINVGNPHAVLVVSDLTSTPVHNLGPEISLHTRFPEQTNAGFMQILAKNHIKLRVYERGSGETKACGSGAVAAAAVGRLYHELDAQIRVSLPGGDLIVDWPDTHGPISLTGPATFVYEGRLF